MEGRGWVETQDKNFSGRKKMWPGRNCCDAQGAAHALLTDQQIVWHSLLMCTFDGAIFNGSYPCIHPADTTTYLNSRLWARLAKVHEREEDQSSDGDGCTGGWSCPVWELILLTCTCQAHHQVSQHQDDSLPTHTGHLTVTLHQPLDVQLLQHAAVEAATAHGVATTSHCFLRQVLVQLSSLITGPASLWML